VPAWKRTVHVLRICGQGHEILRNKNRIDANTTQALQCCLTPPSTSACEGQTDTHRLAAQRELEPHSQACRSVILITSVSMYELYLSRILYLSCTLVMGSTQATVTKIGQSRGANSTVFPVEFHELQTIRLETQSNFRSFFKTASVMTGLRRPGGMEQARIALAQRDESDTARPAPRRAPALLTYVPAQLMARGRTKHCAVWRDDGLSTVQSARKLTSGRPKPRGRPHAGLEGLPFLPLTATWRALSWYASRL